MCTHRAGCFVIPTIEEGLVVVVVAVVFPLYRSGQSRVWEVLLIAQGHRLVKDLAAEISS